MKPRSGLWSWLSRRRDRSAREDGVSIPEPEPQEPDEPDVDDLEPAEATVFEITDVLDLHSFQPREVKVVVRDYLDESYALGFRSVRIIHGRGIGVQRRTVRAILERDPRVVSFADAEAGSGGWGATVVEMS